MLEFTVKEPEITLDVFLRKKINLGLRGVRKLIKKGNITVNGKKCVKRHKKLKNGDRVVVKQDEPSLSQKFELKIIQGNGKIFGVYKPPFIHSAKGICYPSMEDLLKFYYPDKKIWLLNRLDFLTSGILLFTFSDKVQREYKIMQDQGVVEKRYYALIHGKITKKLCIKNKIMDKKRKKVLVCDIEDKDPLRHTLITLKKFYSKENISLIEAHIFKGKRHQIRAHLAYIGHAILGDPVYGKKETMECRMYLHNFKVVFPDFEIKIDSYSEDWINNEKINE
jgi:23S rRNA pseudouridine1911/1915/1917 synthase